MATRKRLGRSLGALVLGYLTTVILTLGMHWVIQFSAPGAFDADGSLLPAVELQVLMLALSFLIAIAAGVVTGIVAGRKEVAHSLLLGTLMALGGFIMAFMAAPEMRMYQAILAIIAVPGVTMGGYICARWRQPRPAAV